MREIKCIIYMFTLYMLLLDFCSIIAMGIRTRTWDGRTTSSAMSARGFGAAAFWMSNAFRRWRIMFVSSLWWWWIGNRSAAIAFFFAIPISWFAILTSIFSWSTISLSSLAWSFSCSWNRTAARAWCWSGMRSPTSGYTAGTAWWMTVKRIKNRKYVQKIN